MFVFTPLIAKPAAAPCLIASSNKHLLLLTGLFVYRIICYPQEVFIYLREKLEEVVIKYGEHVLATPHNPISMGTSSVQHSNTIM